MATGAIMFSSIAFAVLISLLVIGCKSHPVASVDETHWDLMLAAQYSKQTLVFFENRNGTLISMDIQRGEEDWEANLWISITKALEKDQRPNEDIVQEPSIVH